MEILTPEGMLTEAAIELASPALEEFEESQEFFGGGSNEDAVDAVLAAFPAEFREDPDVRNAVIFAIAEFYI